MELIFEKFNKIGRLNKDCTITEKIDGTNAQILFAEDGSFLVGSRNKEIWPNGTEGKEKNCDNAGFAAWVYTNHKALFEYLGPGRHYGEWAGSGIGRKYGMNEKRFYLFNTFRFGVVADNPIPGDIYTCGLDVVPVLYEGPFSTDVVNEVMEDLKKNGSQISAHNDPEGVIVYHHGLRVYAKVTFEYDEGKWTKDS